MALEIPHAGEAVVKAALKGEPLVHHGGAAAYVKSLERMASDLEPPEVKAARLKAAKAAPLGASKNGVAKTKADRPAAGQAKGLLRLFRRA